MSKVRVESFSYASGEPLFQGVDLPALGYECVRTAASAKATHIVLRRKAE